MISEICPSVGNTDICKVADSREKINNHDDDDDGDDDEEDDHHDQPSNVQAHYFPTNLHHHHHHHHHRKGGSRGRSGQGEKGSTCILSIHGEFQEAGIWVWTKKELNPEMWGSIGIEWIVYEHMD